MISATPACREPHAHDATKFCRRGVGHDGKHMYATACPRLGCILFHGHATGHRFAVPEPASPPPPFEVVTVPKATLERVLETGTGHCHRLPGIWDWDNKERAFTPCQRCADFAVLRALLDGAQHVIP